MLNPNDRESQLEQSLRIVRVKFPAIPEAAIILGSGLGGLADEIEDQVAIDYADLPGFAKSTAGGHRGQLICGKLDGVAVVAMAGRFHRYEGYSDEEVTFPVRLMSSLGAKLMIVSNAAGGISSELKVGDIVVIRDHIDLVKTASPLLFLGSKLNPATPNRVSALNGDEDGLKDRLRTNGQLSLYDPELIEVALAAARAADFHAQVGVYLATSGPTYETRAEYRMMRIFGADVVGMSTAPEVRVASLLGMRVLALSMVSNVARPDAPEPADHEEVLQAGRAAAFKLRAIVGQTLQKHPCKTT
jgi:purine-nucleoside phosphorylase